MKYINYADLESEIHDLRIGRTKLLEGMDVDQLTKEIFDLKLDVCKLKIKISENDVFEKIHSIGFPTGIHTLLIRTFFEIEKYDFQDQAKVDIQIYTPPSSVDIQKHVKELFNNQTSIQYSHTLNASLFKSENTESFVSEFFASFNNKVDENKHCFNAFFENKLVGIGLIHTNGEVAEGIDVGIVPEFRSNHFFIEMMKGLMFSFKNAVEGSPLSKCKKFSYNTVLYNPRSLNTSLKFGFKISDAILNINIYSLLGNVSQKLTIYSGSENFLSNTSLKVRTIFNNVVLKEYQNSFNEVKPPCLWYICYTETVNKELFLTFHDEDNLNHGFMKYLICK